MFTINDIHQAFEKVKSGEDFPAFVQDLKRIGVQYYENDVADGHCDYFGANNYILPVEAKYPNIAVSESGSREKLEHALKIHQAGETDYPTFCRQAADAGIAKWRTHMIEMTVNYLDSTGKSILIEKIPVV